MKLGNATLLLLTVIFFSTTAIAGHWSYRHAKVIDVTPIYSSKQINRWPDSCKIHHQNNNSYHSVAPIIFGSAIGGAIGNSLGNNKSDRRIKTIVGATIGGAIGHYVAEESKHNKHQSYSKNSARNYCRVTHKQTLHQKILKGYQVTYKYHGNIYRTFTHTHPGKRIKINMQHLPVVY